MANVKVTVNGKVFGIDCGDGQESRVKELAKYIDERMQDVKNAGAATSEDQLFMITSLIITDELFETRKKSAENDNSENNTSDERFAEIIQAVNTRIGKIAKTVEAI